MAQPVITLQRDDLVVKALKLMKEKDIKSIVIVDEDNFPIDIVTEHDILLTIDDNYRFNPLKKINDLPKKSTLLTMVESESLDDAIKILNEYHIHHVVVTNNTGVLRGIVSSTDIMKAWTKLNKTFPYFPNSQLVH